jgi:hypothetical protein
MRCGDCRFFFSDDDQCRRHAPARIDWLAHHDSELLRDIAWSLRAIAKLGEPNKYDELFTISAEVNEEEWPSTTVNDWCGEFASRENQQ